LRSSVLREIPFRLERSTLFVPASQWSMIEKAASSAADCVCIDLEDSAVSEEKASGRANVVRALTELDTKSRMRTFSINSVDSQFAYRIMEFRRTILVYRKGHAPQRPSPTTNNPNTDH
jgi:malate synthase